MNATYGVANLLLGAILHPGVNVHQGANCAYKRGFSEQTLFWRHCDAKNKIANKEDLHGTHSSQ